MRFNWKKWNIFVLLLFFIFISPVISLNYIVDPMWSFNHSIVIGQRQAAFDERQQKTNWLTFHSEDFNTVIFGDSRVTYLEPHSMPSKAFNYSLSSMRPVEFPAYLSYASQRSKSPIDVVVLGLSFHQTNASNEMTYKKPEFYIKKSNELGYRLELLLSAKLALYSLELIKDKQKKSPQDFYLRKGKDLYAHQMDLPIPKNIFEEAMKADLEIYRTKVYGENYQYTDTLIFFREMLDEFPNARFIVFTTPVSSHLIKLLVKQGHFADYERWLRDLVNVFGEVWHFMYLNEITLDDDNFKDAHHFSNKVANIIAAKIFENKNNIHFNFGIKITRETIEKDLDFLKDNLLFVK